MCKKQLQSSLSTIEVEGNRRRFFCPLCGKHTVLWLLPTTEIKDLPIKCKRCGKESIISVDPEDEN